MSYQASILRFKLEKYDDALVKYTEAITLCRELDDKKNLIENLHTQVWIQYEKAGDYESAYKGSKELETLSREENNWDFVIVCLQYQYDILKALGEKKEAKIVKKKLDSLKK